MVSVSLRQSHFRTVDENGPAAHSFERTGSYRHPEADPSHPRYEPSHLRHKPGDTWIIDQARPCDPDDPGPFGTPGWRPDRRTGRHRRGELPDPAELREGTMARFLDYSDPLARAHDSWMAPGFWERAWTRLSAHFKALIGSIKCRRTSEAPAPQPKRRLSPIPRQPGVEPGWRQRTDDHHTRASRFAAALRGAQRARAVAA